MYVLVCKYYLGDGENCDVVAVSVCLNALIEEIKTQIDSDIRNNIIQEDFVEQEEQFKHDELVYQRCFEQEAGEGYYVSYEIYKVKEL